MQNICDVVVRHATPNQRVITIVVECGPFCGVVGEALAYCFSIVGPERGLEDAKLEVRNLVAAATCPACSNTLDIDSMWACCDQCGHGPLTVEGGRELRVKEIEVEAIRHV